MLSCGEGWVGSAGSADRQWATSIRREYSSPGLSHSSFLTGYRTLGSGSRCLSQPLYENRKNKVALAWVAARVREQLCKAVHTVGDSYMSGKFSGAV